MSKTIIYTEVITLKISKTQKETLDKLKSKNYKVSEFIRQAIKEKLKQPKEYCPF